MKDTYINIFEKHGFKLGRMICSSKSIYRNTYPDNKTYFNANIVSETAGKVWYGDLDLTFDNKKLQDLCNSLNENIYILKESDCREEKENDPINILITKAISKFEPK